MSQTINIGETPNQNEGFKDAIHVSVMCCVSEEPFLYPGYRVRITQIGTCRLLNSKDAELGNDYHGIVDPFHTSTPIRLGEKVWVFVKPGVASSPRHTWDFNTEEDIITPKDIGIELRSNMAMEEDDWCLKDCP